MALIFILAKKIFMGKEPVEILYFDDTHTFQVMVGDEVEVAYLSLYEDIGNEEDEPRYWLNILDMDPEYREKGYAEKLVKQAIDYYGSIYVSTASEQEHEEHEGRERTSRALDEDKRKIVDALVAKGIIRKSWLRNPFEPFEEEDELDAYGDLGEEE